MDVTRAAAEGNALARLRREAEVEMRRVLDDSRPQKRHRGALGTEDTPFVPVDRYRYAIVEELAAGAKGFIVTCNFRREKSATLEASQLLRRYVPAHLFPPPPSPPPPSSQTGEQQPQLQPEQSGEGEMRAEPAASEPRSDAAAIEPGRCGFERAGAAEAAAATRGGNAGESAERGVSAAPTTAAAGPCADRADGDGSCSEDGEDAGDDDGGMGSEMRGVRRNNGSGWAGEAEECADGSHGQPAALGLAKVGCRGVVVIRLSAAAAAAVDPVTVVEAMLADLAAGTLQPPRHCQRIIPMDCTCPLTPAGLAAATAAAAAAHTHRLAKPAAGGAIAAAAPAAVEPFSYAIAYHSRATAIPTVQGKKAAAATAAAAAGAAPAAAAPPPPAAAEAEGKAGGEAGAAAVAGRGAGGVQVEDKEEAGQLMDRGRIISCVAGGMAAAFGGVARVELKKPQVVVLVETFPVAGRQFGGLALLSDHLFTAKGKRVIKPLIKSTPPT